MAIPQNEPDRCGLSWACKVVASGVFLTGREAQEIFNFSCNWMAAPEALMRQVLETRDPTAILELPIGINVDHDTETVRLELNGIEAFARRFGDQGCMVLDDPQMQPAFRPAPVVPNPVQDDFEPEGSIAPDQAASTGLDPAALDAALELAFENPMHFTNAMLVVHKGKVVAERYREPLACVLVDLDQRESLRADGEARLDAAYRELAARVLRAVREIDVVARTPRDEVLLLLPSTPLTGALAVAERLWRSVGDRAFTVPGRSSEAAAPEERALTCTAGIGLFPSLGVTTPETLLEAAASALGEARRSGESRSCVRQHQGYLFRPTS